MWKSRTDRSISHAHRQGKTIHPPKSPPANPRNRHRWIRAQYVNIMADHTHHVRAITDARYLSIHAGVGLE